MPVLDPLVSPETSAASVKKTPQPAKSKKSREGLPFTSGSGAEKGVVVKGWKKLKQQVEQDLLIFKITQEVTLKMEWAALPANIQTAFTDVLTTVKNKGEVYDSETDGECFVFGFTDETVNLSAVCTTLNGKVAFFYKEEVIG